MLEKFKSFYSDPYDPDMDLVDWFLFIGLVLVALMVWSRIFKVVGDTV